MKSVASEAGGAAATGPFAHAVRNGLHLVDDRHGNGGVVLAGIATLAVLFVSVLVASCNVAATTSGSSSAVDLTFSVSTPTYQAITFPSTDVSVVRGNTVQLTTTNTDLLGVSGWHWYVDNELDATQTGSTFTWDTTGKSPGQHTINVEVPYQGVTYSGSLRVTITY